MTMSAEVKIEVREQDFHEDIQRCKKLVFPFGLRGEDLREVFRPAEKHSNGYREGLRAEQR